MTSPILFLDIDGVLNIRRSTRLANSAAATAAMPKAHRSSFPRFVHTRDISAAAVTHLNALCRRSGVLVVVSSSWRLRGDVRPTLVAHGVSCTFHEDWATDADGPDRGAEIGRWLSRHGEPEYVVLDDWPSGLSCHSHRVVRPDFKLGLQAHDCDQALELLGLRW